MEDAFILFLMDFICLLMLIFLCDGFVSCYYYSCGIVKISSDWTDIYPLPIYAVLNHNSLFTNWIPPGVICLMLKQKIWCGSFNCILFMVHKFPSMLFLPHCFQGFHLRFFFTKSCSKFSQLCVIHAHFEISKHITDTRFPHQPTGLWRP